jgi:CDP-L-myo-inositol myo-inositolphosphotransferase
LPRRLPSRWRDRKVKCVILAAGNGARLREMGNSKPLISLLGVHLIERVILTAKKSGINDFYVVTGYNGDRVRGHLEYLSERRGINVTIIQNDEWEKDNGVSVLKAKECINETFILLMCDHIFDESILANLKNEKMAAGEVILAVDHAVDNNDRVDLVDATKVLVDKTNRILEIDKSLDHYNAFDTGIFLCSPKIFSALEESARNGDCTLSGGIKIMAAKGMARTIDIKGAYWVDVDDKQMFKKAEKTLWATLKKPSDGPISRFVNRPISTRITRHLLKTNIRPNHISFFSFLLAALGTCFFLLGNYINLVIGAFLVQTSSVVDGTDGEIARLKFQETEFGAWLDAVLDRYADALIILGLTIYSSIQLTQIDDLVILSIGFLALMGAFMNSYTAMKYDGLTRIRGRRLRIGRDVRLFIIFLACLINQPFLALLSIALVANGENIRRIVVFRNHASSSYGQSLGK